MTKIVMVVSGVDHWTLTDGTKDPSGFWAEELVVPHQVFTKAGFEIVIAAPQGGNPPPIPQASGRTWQDRRRPNTLHTSRSWARNWTPPDRCRRSTSTTTTPSSSPVDMAPWRTWLMTPILDDC